MGVWHRGRVYARRDQTGEMGHVNHQVCADLIGDAAEFGEVEPARIGRPAGQDQFGLPLVGQPLDLGHVDPVVVLADVVGRDVIQFAGEVQLHAVRQMPAVRQIQAEDGVTGGQQCGHGRRIRLRSGVRLHIRVRRAEQGLRPLDREPLGDINVLATAVVTPARIALGVLVRHH
ncbi:Uncharacterised protein [Mycobacteroides abscessus subsp. bolletii]|nr:Uncharacterised protein [Mycobacteroides abscessus subsp. bolletii]